MIRLIILLLTLLGFSAAAATPNLLFILADDMGWQDTSVAFAKERTKFNDRFHTPALERLAREGMKFTQAYSCAVCSPTRVSFLTGQNQTRHHVTQWTHITGDKPTPDLPHPSLRKVAGALAPIDSDGIDLAPLFAGAKAPTTFSRPLVWHFPNFWGSLKGPPVEGPGMGPCSTIRRGDWKLICRHGDQGFELFDLANDLGETTNFASQEPRRVGELAKALSAILRSHRSPMPIVKANGQSSPMPDQLIGH